MASQASSELPWIIASYIAPVSYHLGLLPFYVLPAPLRDPCLVVFCGMPPRQLGAPC